MGNDMFYSFNVQPNSSTMCILYDFKNFIFTPEMLGNWKNHQNSATDCIFPAEWHGEEYVFYSWGQRLQGRRRNCDHSDEPHLQL